MSFIHLLLLPFDTFLSSIYLFYLVPSICSIYLSFPFRNYLQTYPSLYIYLLPNYQMEQYFARQTNCCQLNFSNSLAPKHKYIISPQKSTNPPKLKVNKSSKKSLKAVPSYQSLTNSQNNRKSMQFQYRKPDSIKRESQMNEYYQKIDRKGRTETKNLDTRKQSINFLQPQKIKQVKSLERNQFIHSPIKHDFIEDFRPYRFSQKPNLIIVQREQHPRESVVTTPMGSPAPTFRQQSPPNQTIPYYYREAPNPYANIQVCQTSPQFYPISNFGQSPSKQISFRQSFASTPFQGSQKNLTKAPVLKKQSTTNYNESFKKIYGEVEIEDQIKHDLMASLEANDKKKDFHNDYGYQNENTVSIMTKCPPSQESTILPADSKLKTKAQYQIDSFAHPVYNSERKGGTEKFLKAESLLTQQPGSMLISGRQKFKSIVSVESEHSSSSSEIDSVILDKHPQHLLSSNPIKSLL